MQSTTIHNLAHASALNDALANVIAAQTNWLASQQACEIAGDGDVNIERMRCRERIARHTFDFACDILAGIKGLPAEALASPAPAPAPEAPKPARQQSAGAGAGRQQQQTGAKVSVRRRAGNARRQQNHGPNPCPNDDCPNDAGNYQQCYACHSYPDRVPGQCVTCDDDANPAFAECWQCHNADASA